jgi:hypothetical protein
MIAACLFQIIKNGNLYLTKLQRAEGAAACLRITRSSGLSMAKVPWIVACLWQNYTG